VDPVEASFHEVCVAALHAAERHDVVTSLERIQSARDMAESLATSYRARGELLSANNVAEHLVRTFEECKAALSRAERPVLDKAKVDGRTRGLQAVQVTTNLWQARVPYTRKGRLELRQFATVVSCVSMPSTAGPYLHAPLKVEGRALTHEERKLVHRAADTVYQSITAGRKTVVLCADGKVASGLIVALVLKRLAQQPWEHVVRRLQQLREGAVGNLYFVQVLVEEDSK